MEVVAAVEEQQKRTEGAEIWNRERTTKNETELKLSPDKDAGKQKNEAHRLLALF
jgi:hypothetical protein